MKKKWIKEYFDKGTPAYSQEQLWENISHKLDQRKRRSFIWWLFPFTLMVGIGIYSYLTDDSHNNFSNQLTESEANLSSVQSKDIVQSKLNNGLNTTISSSSFEVNQEILQDEDVQSFQHRSHRNVNTSASLLDNITLGSIQDEITSISDAIGGQNVTKGFSSSSTKLSGDNSILKLTILNNRQLLLSYNPPKFRMKEDLFVDEGITPMTKTSRTIHSVFAEGGVLLGNRNLDFDQTIEANTEQLMEATQVLETIFTSIGATINFKKWKASIGVQYQRRTELFKGIDVEESSQLFTSDTAFYIISNDQKQYFEGETIATIRKTRQVTSPNIIKSVFIPISIGYHIMDYKRIHVFGSTGLAINVLNKRTGINVNNDGSFIFKDAKVFDTQYHTIGVHRIIAGLHFNYRFTPKSILSLGLQFQSDLSSSFKSQAINSNYKYYGASIRYQYLF